MAIIAKADTHYVNLNNPSPTPPYTNWLTAATNIQDAVDAAEAGDTVLVTNGVYATGGRVVSGLLTNRVAITKMITVQSVNGPLETVIEGYQVPSAKFGNAAVRCVYITNGAMLIGFTITNGATRMWASGIDFREYEGGGILAESETAIVSNCIVTGNYADSGGGVRGGMLTGCTVNSNACWDRGGGVLKTFIDWSLIAYNSAPRTGGGCAESTVRNCVLVGNTALSGGGAFLCTLDNSSVLGNSSSASPGDACSRSVLRSCIVLHNQGGNYGGGASPCSFTNSCTTPLPPLGVGNITNEPLFVNTNNWANLRLQSNSPCINAGNNAYVTSATDLDGNPRTAGGTVDIGAYEFQSPSSVLSYAWAQQYGLPTDGTADFADTDNEGMNNYQEWRSDTVPTNAASALRMATLTNAAAGLDVSWESVSNRSYWLERGGDLGAAPAFQTISTNIPGVAGVKTFNDLSATNGGPYFYRVGVQ
jgi:hypothetical protein